MLNLAHRTRGRLALGVLAVIFACAGYCGAQTNVDNGPTLDSFKIIRQRNIFNPNRTGRIRIDNGQQVRRRVTDTFSLVGTMSYAKGQFAFFDGSSSQFKKVLESGGNIAGYTVKEISPNAVTLALNGKELEMKVGAQFRNEASSGWRLSTQMEQSASADGESGSTDSTASAAESSAPPAGLTPQMTDRLKQLMENRQKELQ